MKNFEKKYILRDKFEAFGSGGSSNEVFTPRTDLVYGEKNGDFQENKYDVYIRSKGKFSEIKIDDNGANTIIKKVPKGKEQEVLNSFYGRYTDSICDTVEYTYNPSMFKDMASRRVIGVTRENLSSAEIQNRVSEIKSKAPKLYAKLVASGILINDVENTEQLKKLEAYMDYLNFLYNVTRKSDLSSGEVSQEIAPDQKSELVKRYLELESEKTDYIGNKEFLQFKFAEAVLSDIKRMGYFVVKDSNGAYKIKGIDSLSDFGNAAKFSKIAIYSKLFETKNTNNSAIDTAILSNVIVHNPEMKKVTSQKQFINKLLDKYNILPTKRKNIEDKTDYLILDNTKILKNIKDKLENSKSAQEIKELSVLLNFVKNKRWEQKTSYDRFNKANTYAKGFLIEKRMFNAYKKGELSELQTDKDFLGQMSDFVNQNRGGAIVIALFSWILGFKKTALGSMIVGVFGGSMMNMVKGGVNGAKSLIKEDIIKPLEKDQISTLLDNKEYQDKHNALVKFNSELDNNQLSETDEAGVVIDSGVNQLDSEKLNNMVTDITDKSINIDLDLTDSDDKLLAALGTGYSLDEVKQLIKIFKKSGIKEEGDKTTLDYLTDGVDIMNKPYNSPSFTGVNEIDKKINETLKAKWTKVGATRKDRKSILKIKATINSELSATKGAIDVTKTFFSNLWQKTGGDNKIEEPKDIDIQTRILNAISATEAIDGTIGAQIKPNLESYGTYIKLEENLSKYVGLIDNNWESNKAGLFNIFGIASDSTEKAGLSRLNTDVTKSIAEIKELIIKCGTNPELKEIKKEAEKKLKLLKKVKEETNKKLGLEGVTLSSNEIKKEIKANTNFDEHLVKVDKAYNELKEIEDGITIIKLENLESSLKKVGESYKVLERYSDAYKNIEVLPNGNLVENATNVLHNALKFKDNLLYNYFKSIDSELYDYLKPKDNVFNDYLKSKDNVLHSVFESKDTVNNIKSRLGKYKGIKDSIKTKLEKPLEDFYKANSDKIDMLSATNSSFKKDIKALAEVEKYLKENKLSLSTEQEIILSSLKESQNQAKLLLEKLKEKAIEEGKTAEEISRIEKALTFVKKDIPEFASSSYKNTKEFFNSVGDFFGNGLDKINSIDFDLGTLKSQTINLFNTSKEKAKEIISESKDKQAEKALKEGKKAFGDTEFLNGVSKKTLKNVLDKYNDKKEKVKTKATARLTKIEKEISGLSTKEEFQNKYREVKKIGELFPEMKTKVEGIKKLIKINYIKKILVKNDVGVKKSVNEIYNYSGNEKNLQNLAQKFKEMVNSNISNAYGDSIYKLLSKMKKIPELKGAAKQIFETKLDLYK